MKLKKNKKGNILDIMFVIVLLFGTLIGMTATFFVWDDVITDLNNTASINDVSKAQLNRDQANIPGVMDSMFVLVLFGAFISIIVAAYLIKSNFLFFMIAIFVLAIFLFITAVLSNVYEDFRESDPLMDAYVEENFSLSNHILNNYVLYVMAMSFLVIISLYAKVTRNVES